MSDEVKELVQRLRFKSDPESRDASTLLEAQAKEIVELRSENMKLRAQIGYKPSKDAGVCRICWSSDPCECFNQDGPKS